LAFRLLLLELTNLDFSQYVESVLFRIIVLQMSCIFCLSITRQGVRPHKRIRFQPREEIDHTWFAIFRCGRGGEDA